MSRNVETPFFTIFIPTYNRAHTLPRALESIEKQSFRDFEVVIIDDGSIDGTGALVEGWQKRVDFPVHYHWQSNQGKHVAHNTALRFAKGEFTVILDSDDALMPDALKIFKNSWETIHKDQKQFFAGIEGLCAHMENGKIAGTPFPHNNLDSNYFEIRKIFQVGGDKKSAVRTDLLRRFPFPQIPGEKHIRPSLLWKRLSRKYRFRYINSVIQLIEYQEKGLSADRFRLRMSNPLGFRFYFLEEINLNWAYYGFRDHFRNSSNYVRYSLHSGVGIGHQATETTHPLIWAMSLPSGCLHWMWDQVRMLGRNLEKEV